MTEYVLNRRHGYGKKPRRPLLELNEKEGEVLMEQFREMFALEDEYA